MTHEITLSYYEYFGFGVSELRFARCCPPLDSMIVNYLQYIIDRQRQEAEAHAKR